MIDPARRARNPLLTSEGAARLDRIAQHRSAPTWNVQIGDRVVASDLHAVAAFREVVASARATTAPPEALLAWMAGVRSAIFVEALRGGRAWSELPTMSREDLALRLPDVVPVGADLDRLIVYDTSGTTGHALRLPHHPRAVALNHALLERALAAWGVSVRAGADLACVNLCAQWRTHVFATVFSVWDQAGFAKVNLSPRAWSPKAARDFLGDLRPGLWTADPITLAGAMAWGVDAAPEAIVSTAVRLEPALRAEVAARYGCPVIDWYSTTETGPIAASVPDDPDALAVIAPDVWVEAVDASGRPVGPDREGEITVTGGRNPYVPLLRYRTGDRGRVSVEAGPDGPRTVIRGLQGRGAVFFRAADGGLVNPVDVGRQLRLRGVFVQSALHQRADGSATLRIRLAPDLAADLEGMEADLSTLFGRRVPVIVDPELGLREKVVPWSRET